MKVQELISANSIKEAQGDGRVEYSGEVIMVRRNSDSTFTASVKSLHILTDPYTEFDDALDDAKAAVDSEQKEKPKKDVYGDDMPVKYSGFKKKMSEAKGTGAMYKISWEGYHNNPKPEKHDLDYFSDSNGFSKHDRSEIMALDVGQEWTSGGPMDSVAVERIK